MIALAQRALADKVALVTGASRGIGQAVAVALARHGAHVVLTARTQGGLEETDDLVRGVHGKSTLLPLDLREGARIDAIGPSLFNRFGHLDILVHAAAVLGKLTPVPHIMDADWAETVGVNLDATLHIIRTCAPLLTRADAGRAVFLTDPRAAAPHAYWGLYAATKAAAEHLVLTWAEEVRITKLRVNLFAPGPVATRLRRQAYPGEDATALRQPAAVASELVALCMPDETRHAAIIAG